MEVKKNKQVDLENKRGIFVHLGLLLSLGFVFGAFTWSNKIQEGSGLGSMEMGDVVEDDMPITMMKPQTPPPPPPPPPTVVELLNIVEDDVLIEDELDIEDSEADKNTEIEVAQVVEEVEQEVEEDKIFLVVEDKPEFPGGDLALLKWISKSVKYPVVAMENGISGRILVNFVVGIDGKITDAKILRGVAPALDKEALRVVNSMPRWKPGRQRGKAVRVSFTAPINFVLQ